MSLTPGEEEGLGSPAPPALSRSGLDRAAHRRTDGEWLDKAWAGARVLVVDGHRTLVRDAADRPELVLVDSMELAEVPAGGRLFLGTDPTGTAYFAVAGALPDSPGARVAELGKVGDQLGDLDASLLTTAVGLANWHGRYGYSPLTGAPTTSGAGGWLRHAPDGAELFPRTDPAVIMLLTDGVPGPDGRCLLAAKPDWPPRWWSCLAGFVEPGESAEAAVVRESAEEVGLAVRDVRYRASQPWPFPACLMLAFTAIADPDTPIVVDETELASARWFTRTDMAGPDGPNRSHRTSVAAWLIDNWLSER